MKRVWLRRAGLALLLVGGGGVALVVGGLVFLTTERGNELIRRELITLAGPLIPGGKLELDHLRLNLVSELELEGLRLLDQDGAPIVNVHRLAVRYSLADVLDSKLTVHELALDGPEINLSADSQGELNLMRALGVGPSPPSNEPPTPWSGLPGVLEVESARITDGALRYSAGDTHLSLDGLNVSLGATIDHGDIAARDLHFSAAMHEPAALPLSLDGALDLTDDVLNLGQIRAGLGETRLTLDGVIAAAQVAPKLNVHVEAHARPLDIAALAGTSVLKQDLDARLDLDGPLASLKLEGELRALAGQLALQGELDLEGDPLAWQVQLGTGGLDLDALLEAVTEPTHLDGRYELSGTGTAWPELPGQTDPDLIRGTVRIDARDQVLWGEPLRDLKLEAKIDAGRIAIQRLVAGAAVGSARLQGEVDVPAGSARLRGEVHLPDLGALAKYGVSDLSGSATWSGATAVRWSEPEVHVEADGTLSGAELGLPGGVHLGEFSAPLNVVVDGEAVSGDGELHVARLEGSGATVEQVGGAWTVRREADGTLNLDLTGLDLGGLAVPEADLTLTGVGGDAAIALDAAGRPSVKAALNLTDLRLPTGVVASGPVSATLDGDAVTADLGLVAGPNPVLVANARGDLGSGGWVITDLKLGLTQDAVWSASQPVRMTLAEGGVRNLVLALESPVGAVSASGDLFQSAFAVQLDLRDVDLAWVSRQVKLFDPSDPLTGLAGRATGSVHLSGTPGAPEGTAQLTVDELVFPGAVEAPIRVDARVDLAGGLVQLDGAVDRGKERWLTLGGEVPLDVQEGAAAPRCGSPLAVRAIVGPVSGEALSEVIPSVKGTFEQFSADLHLRGDVCDPSIALNMATTSRAADPDRVMRVDLDLTRESSDFALRGGLALDGARRVQLDGRATTGLSAVFAYALRGGPEPDVDAPATWLSALEVNAVPLAVPLSVLGAPSSVTGTLVGGLQLSGDLNDLTFAGGLQWMDGKLGGIPLTLGYFGLEPEDGGYQLTALLGFEEGGGLQLTGFVPMRLDVAGDLDAGLESAFSDNRLNLNISDGNNGPARLPLEAIVSGQSDLSDARGALELSGQVTGSLIDPHPDLELGLYGGAVTMASTGVRYDEITVNTNVVREAVRIRDLSVRTRPRFGAVLRTGTLVGAGEIALEGFAPQQVALNLHMNDFWANATPDLLLALDGDLTVRGPWPSLALEGDIKLGQARVTRSRDSFLDNASFMLNPDIQVSRQGVVAARSRGEVPAVWEQFKLGLNLDLARNLSLKVEVPTSTEYGKQVAQLSGVTLDADLDGNLELKGTAGAPVVRGVIETVSGSMLLLGKKFELVPDGEISFAGGDYDDPILNLEAVQSTEYGDVHAYITRHVSDIKVEFKADDYPDPADATALILFGRPGSELTDSQGSSNLSALALASLSGEIERAVGLSAIDQFEVDPTSTAVRVGKALSDNLFLTLQFQQVGTDTSENAAQATVEWTIRRKLTAEFVTGDAGKSSADLYWRWRF